MKKVFALTLIPTLALLANIGTAADGHDHHHQHEAHEHHEHDDHAKEHEAHGAHEHGVAHLDTVLEKNQAHIALRSPAANIVGFEHHPQNDEQHVSVNRAMQTLQSPELFRFVGSECRLVEAHIETELLDENSQGHSDFEVEYSFKCSDTSVISSIETALFQHFPGIEHLQVQFIKGTRQGAAHLTSDNPVLRF